MNLDKSISDLTKKLDELYPSTAFIDTAKLNDGINYWKGKKIIPVKEWNNIYDKHSICTKENETTLVSRKPLQYFPDDYNDSISVSAIVDEKLREEIQNWNTDLSKVKPISSIIQIINEQDIYNILTNREKLEYLLQEYEKKNQLEKEGEQSKQLEEELDREYPKANLKAQIKEELEKSDREQQILLKEYKQDIIDFIINNKDSIRVEDLKISEPFYKCYREKANCSLCNNLSNIICTNCCNSHKEIWLCTKHWPQHKIEKHE